MPTKNQPKLDPTQTDEYMITNQQFSSAVEFSQHIERKASLRQNYIDVLTDFCVRNEVEIESVKKLLTPSLKEKITAEAQNLNLLKQKNSGKLPI
jgi:hypothetical protein